MHPDLKYAGVLPPLDAPHHLRSTEWGPYREGVVLRAASGRGSWLDVGLDRDAHVPQARRRGWLVGLRTSRLGGSRYGGPRCNGMRAPLG